jgi:mono/diheme cytochrome c family protein
MIDHRPIVKNFFFSVLFITAFSSINQTRAQDGQSIFRTNCGGCHAVARSTGAAPALKDFHTRGPWADRKELYAWIKNPAAYMAKDPYTQSLKPQYNNQVMPGFPNLSTAEIDAIAEYLIKASAAPEPTPGKDGQGDPSTVAKESDNALLYGILTLILAIIALILLQVNSNLKKLSDDKEGVPAYEPVPFYRNKAYISLLTIVLFVIGGYYTIQGAISLGRTKDYQPVQPIYYSHKVHVGKNQISCLYCHSSALEGKQANIPSVNQCMNCHIAVSEYTGSGGPLFDEDGKEINGTAEIQKLYKYAGWDPAQRKYVNQGQEVEWVRIHNLPDHVYFNHSQHVNAGKVQCQTCHGPIQEMDEVKQFSDLSMGWCVNCHRETKVQFTSNKFYSIYEKFHEDLKKNPSDSITVSKIGGTECQKCHY